MIRSLNFLEIKLRQPRIVIALAVGFLFFYLAPLIIYGQNLYFQIFDNLDSNVVWLKILAESGMIFSDSNAIIPNMMGGLPRHTYGSEFNIQLWLFYFLPPFTAYVINEIIIHAIAFISMWIFLSHHVISPTRGNMIVIATGALYFALLPFWPWGGLSVPAMPLVVHAMLNIRSRTATWRDWSILGLIPLYSSLVLVYFFFLLAAGLFWIVDSIRKRDWQWPLIGAIVFMGIVYLGVEYRLLYSTFFDSSFVSHRTEFTIYARQTLMNSYCLSGDIFLNGQIHTKENHFPFLLPLVAVTGTLIYANRRFKRWETVMILGIIGLATMASMWDWFFTTRYTLPTIVLAALFMMLIKRDITSRWFGWIMILIVLTSLWYGFWFNEIFQSIGDYIPFMKSFNFSRVVFFQQFLWGIIAVIVAYVIIKRLRFSTIIIYLFWSSILYVAVNNGTFTLTKNTNAAKRWDTDYQKYYSVQTFKQIKRYINKPVQDYRIMSLGMNPLVSLYNGFYTTDGYSVNYPLEYKHAFKKIIENDLQTGSSDDIAFNQWGSKCYLLYPNIMYDYPNVPEAFDHVNLNVDQMYRMGTRYLITPFPMKNLQKELKYEREFKNIEGESEIYLYRLQPLLKGN